MIDKDLKRCLGQMMKGVQVVAATHDGLTRAYCSHWVSQVSFEEPIVMASVSPKHDTFPLMEASGRWAVSILAGDQVTEGQYFSYPGRRFKYLAPEYIDTFTDDAGVEWPIVPNSVAWLFCETFDVDTRFDHHLFFARVIGTAEGRLKEPPLLYSSRLGWRITGDKAREPGVSIRDALLERLAALEADE